MRGGNMQRKRRKPKGRFRDIVSMGFEYKSYYGCECSECRDPNSYVVDDTHKKGECYYCKQNTPNLCSTRNQIIAARMPRERTFVVVHRSGEIQRCSEVAAKTVGQRLNQIRKLRARVKQQRLANKEHDRTIASTFGTVNLGGHRRQVRDLLAQKDGAWKIALCQKDYGPLGPDRHVGVEIECGIDCGEDTLREKLSKAGLSMRTTLVGDGSVEVEDLVNIELRVCDKESRIYNTLDKVCDILQECGADVNDTCGLHVHLDMRSRDWQKAYKRLYAALRWLYACVSNSRKKGNKYCQRPPAEPDLDERYLAINATAVNAHRTLEVRLHQGTVNAKKIKNWVRFLLAIVDGPDVQRMSTDLNVMAKRLNLAPDLTQYIAKRARKFGQDDPKLRIPEPLEL